MYCIRLEIIIFWKKLTKTWNQAPDFKIQLPIDNSANCEICGVTLILSAKGFKHTIIKSRHVYCEHINSKIQQHTVRLQDLVNSKEGWVQVLFCSMIMLVHMANQTKVLITFFGNNWTTLHRLPMLCCATTAISLCF